MADDQLALDRAILGEVMTSNESYEVLRHLCDTIGHRFGGSDSEKAGAAFLQQKMQEYGLQNVGLEEFGMAGWDRGPAALSLNAPVSRDFSCVAMPYCPPADLTAELVDVGDGELRDFQRLKDQVQGRIVISAAETNRPGERGSHRTDKFNWAIEHGAVGHIFVNQNPGMLHITGSISAKNPKGTTAADRESPIPGVGVSWEAGQEILRHMRYGDGEGVVTLKLENKTHEAISRNVIGEVVGSEFPDEVVLIGGHFDGHDISQSAGDDGAGTVTGLEAARALATLKGKLKRTVRVICFGSEEIGLLGAVHHARERNPDSFRFVMNLDGAGRGIGGREQMVLSGWPELAPWFQRWSEEHHYPFTITDALNSHSDHFPFALRGIPNGTLNSQDRDPGMVGRGYGHTEADTFDKIHLRGLQMSAQLVARLAASIANAEDWPAKRRSVEQVREQLSEAKLLDRIERSNRASLITGE